MSEQSCKGCLHAFTRAAYYGGRVEVFRETVKPGDNARLADVNSMYPSVMLEPMPFDLRFVKDGEIDFKRASKYYLGFIDCEVRVPPEIYTPPLPFRFNGRLIFPSGVFRGTYTSVEISRLLRDGGSVTKWFRSAWFSGNNIFDGYVKHFYKYRDKAAGDYSEIMSAIAKLMLNALYGKLGMSEERQLLWLAPEAKDFDEHLLKPIGDISNEVFVEEIRVTPTYIIPHIAAWVTSLARIKLYDLMTDFLARGFKIWYCDTDSIVTDAVWPESTSLGGLKLEATISEARFVAPKMYMMKLTDGTVKIRAKGFGGFGRTGLSLTEFESLVDGHSKIALQKMTKFREGCKTTDGPRMKIVNKGVNFLDSKRVHLGDGNTQPIHIGGY